MKNWANPTTPMSLEGACDEITRNHKPGVTPYIERIGLEVYGPYGCTNTLYPIYDSVGFPPAIGEQVECSGLGIGTVWTVTAYAIGYPGKWRIVRQ